MTTKTLDKLECPCCGCTELTFTVSAVYRYRVVSVNTDRIEVSLSETEPDESSRKIYCRSCSELFTVPDEGKIHSI